MLLVLALTVCGPTDEHCFGRMTEASPVAPEPLERSVFARDPQGALSEEALQQILAAPIELDLPSRVGVLPVITAADWRGPSPDYQKLPLGLSAFTRALRGAEAFSLVTEMLPIPSGALGMEALREVAARYRLRYVFLYREQLRQRSKLRGAALGYVTVLGALFVPGQRLEVDGVIEASLFDVRPPLLSRARSFTEPRIEPLVHGRQARRLGAIVLGSSPPALAETWSDVLLTPSGQVERDRRPPHIKLRGRVVTADSATGPSPPVWRVVQTLSAHPRAHRPSHQALLAPARGPPHLRPPRALCDRRRRGHRSSSSSFPFYYNYFLQTAGHRCLRSPAPLRLRVPAHESLSAVASIATSTTTPRPPWCPRDLLRRPTGFGRCTGPLTAHRVRRVLAVSRVKL